ncbi:MAG: hypothetical protein ABIB43_05690 [archaeon]
MGRHYDTFLTVVDKYLVTNGEIINQKPIVDYLTEMAEKAVLTELTFESPSVQELMGKSDKEYEDFLLSFFKKSKQNYKAILTPHTISALEDKDSVVIVDNKDFSSFNLVSCTKGLPSQGIVNDNVGLFCAELSLKYETTNKLFAMTAKPLYNLMGTINIGFESFLDGFTKVFLSIDAVTAATSFIEQVAYLDYLNNKTKD